MALLHALLVSTVLGQAPLDDTCHAVGFACVDVTPAEPIRLSGYASRGSPTASVAQPLFARAMAIDDGQGEPGVLVAVDSIGIPWHVRVELAARLAGRVGLQPERLALLSTHSHTAPQIAGQLENIFGMPIVAAEMAAIERYTDSLLDRLEEVALAALSAREPARLSFARGSAGFAANRRTSGGPVDRSVPLLVAHGAGGELLGLLASYACHCTTLGGDTNEVCGDWAGFAAEYVETAHEGAVALIGIGCGADANPEPRTGMDLARAHGRELAGEIERLLVSPRRAIGGAFHARMDVIDLAWDAVPTRAEWEARAAQDDAVGHNARMHLARIDRGEDVARPLAYPVGAWSFGADLAMVFLAGEVVVDYSIRLARELDAERAWVFGYANDLPCYIPSRRILAEGGYEAEGAMTYYARPGRLAPAVEDAIVGTVLELLPEDYRANGEGPRPLDPEAARACFVLADPALDIELVAAEAAILDPVAIDFDLAGRVWVAEMRDYPSGMDGNLAPGGAIRVLEDEDQDGFYESSTVFLRELPFPTAVAVWRDGVLIAAAPDLLFARDTDGDLEADEVKTLFTGFPTHNEQARVNSLQLGLDGWWYAATGLFGAPIARADGTVVADTSGRDFRFRPDTLELEPVSGLSQHGRVRDDFGEWFGCDSGTLAWHFPIPDAVLARNPHVEPPSPRVTIASDPDANRVFPVGSFVERFNEENLIGRLTAGCGIGFYRDVVLGEEYAGDLFVCEPAYNLVTRLELERTGTTFTAKRAPREREREFLASSDPWFRPVQAITAPDGSLWIVDMYRRVIEHPRWIPPERLAKVDVRAGCDRGRIWRVVRKNGGGALPRIGEGAGAPPEPGGVLARALDSANGTLRDRLVERLIAMEESGASEALRELLDGTASDEVRVSALAALEGIDALTSPILQNALAQSSPRVRRAALAAAGRRESMDEDLLSALCLLVGDPDSGVRMELACVLGEVKDRRAGDAVAKILVSSPDPYIQAACLAAAPTHLRALCDGVLYAPGTPKDLLRALAATAAVERDLDTIVAWMNRLALPDAGDLEHRMGCAAVVLDAAMRIDWDIDGQEKEAFVAAWFGMRELFHFAREAVHDPDATLEKRLDALTLVSYHPIVDAFQLVLDLVAPDAPPELSRRAIELLGPDMNRRIAGELLERATSVGPSLRQEIVFATLAREESTQLSLERAVDDPTLAAAFDLAQRQRLRAHDSADVRALAERAFGERPTPARAECVASVLSKLDRPGDAALGAEVFAQQCAKCHRLEGAGNAVGPDLAAVTDRSDEALLQSILDPNRAVLDAYVLHVLQTTGGEQYEGIVSEETATGLVLTGSDGEPRRIRRTEIASVRPTRVSLMPDGFELLLSQADFENLLAFLRLPREPRRIMAGNDPARIVPTSAGNLLLEACTAEIYGEGIVFEAPFQNLGFWHGALDRAEWVIELPEAGDFEVHLEWACAPDTAGNVWVLEAAGARLEGIVPSTGGWDRYETARVGTMHLPAGERRVILRPGRDPEWALMDLRSISLVRE